VLLAAAVAGWLSSPELANQLWPSDINRQIASALGGTVESDVLGADDVRLGTVSVWIRLFAVTLAIFAATSFLHRRASTVEREDSAGSMLRQTATVAFIGSAWWLFYFIGDVGIAAVSTFCVGVLPIWCAMVVATLAWIWWQALGPGRRSLADGSDVSDLDAKAAVGIGPRVFLGSVMLLWVCVSWWMNYCLYEQLMIPHGDSAMYEEHLWNVSHGKGFRSYLDQGLFLGEHVQVIHLLLLPIHLLWPSHLMLELAESIALASCAIPIYLIAKRHTKHAWAAAILGVSWLFYYPMHFLDIAIDQKTFRPISLGLPFLFWTIEFAERRRFGKTTVCLLLALSAKEDMALITFPLLAVLALRAGTVVDSCSEASLPDAEQCRARNWLLGLSAFSAMYLVVVVLVVIPAFRSGDHVHYSRYFGDLGGSPGELVRTAVTDPLKVVRAGLTIRTVLYFLVFLAPLAMFAIRKAWMLVAGIVTFGMLSLLQFGGPESGGLPPVPYHHFHAPLLPVVFWVSIVALAEVGPLRSGRHRSSSVVNPRSRAMLVLFCCIATAATGSLMPCGVGFWSTESPFGNSQLYNPTNARQQLRAEMVAVLLKQIPLNARVASTDYIHTRLTHCERSFDYSGYLRKVNNYQPGVPADTDYIVIDTGHRYSEIKTAADIPELQADDSPWELLPDATQGIFLILKRKDRIVENP